MTRKLTVNYGLRWDYATPEHEQYGRLGQFNPTLPNANAGGHWGDTVRQHLQLHVLQDRLSLRARAAARRRLSDHPKTVFRGGWGYTYQFVANPAGATIGTNGVYPLSGINPYVNIATPGSIVQPTWPVTNPNVYPVAGTVGPDTRERIGSLCARRERKPAAPHQPIQLRHPAGDHQEFHHGSFLRGQPRRLAGQRTSGYCGWHRHLSDATGAQLKFQPPTYAQYGFYPYPGTGPAGYQQLCRLPADHQPLNSTAVQARLAASGHASFTPYAGFPATNSLTSALYPFPQYGGILDRTPRPAVPSTTPCKSRRPSASRTVCRPAAPSPGPGLRGARRQNFFNPQSAVWQLQQIPPQDLNFNAIYTVPEGAVPTQSISNTQPRIGRSAGSRITRAASSWRLPPAPR